MPGQPWHSGRCGGLGGSEGQWRTGWRKSGTPRSAYVAGPKLCRMPSTRGSTIVRLSGHGSSTVSAVGVCRRTQRVCASAKEERATAVPESESDSVRTPL